MLVSTGYQKDCVALRGAVTRWPIRALNGAVWCLRGALNSLVELDGF